MLAAGCSRSAERPTRDPAHVEAQIVDRAQLDTLLASRRGDVVLVDYWARWCEQCVENLPHMIELADRDWNRGLSVVMLDMEAPESVESVTAFLQERRAGTAIHAVSKSGGSSDSMELFAVPDGTLPCYKLYDRKGQLRHTFAVDPSAEKQFTLQDIDAAVEQLLAE